MSTIQEMIDQGVREVLLETVEMLLRQRFGKLAPETLERLQRATARQLRTWARRLVHSRRLDDVFSIQRSGSHRPRKK